MIVVTDLSNYAETESFRVDGLGNAKLLIVQCALDRYKYIKSNPVRDLWSQIHYLQAEKSAREQEVAILETYGKSMGQNRDLTPDQVETFSDTLFDKVIACGEAVWDIDAKVSQLTLKANEIQSTGIGAWLNKAVITIVADEDGPAQLRLIYREGIAG